MINSKKSNIVVGSVYKHPNMDALDLSLKAPTPENGQTHSNNLLATAKKLFECVWSFCGFGTLRANTLLNNLLNNISKEKKNEFFSLDILTLTLTC